MALGAVMGMPMTASKWRLEGSGARPSGGESHTPDKVALNAKSEQEALT